MDDLITTERVTLVAVRLMTGESGTVDEIAAWTGLHPRSARKMLNKMSRVGPFVSIGGRWSALLGHSRLLQCDADD